MPDPVQLDGSRGRIGLIIPSSNRLSEPQLTRYSPPGVQFHTTRLRMTGAYHAPPLETLERIRGAATMLADAKVDLILFHCTANSMEGGPGADEAIASAIRDATGVPATTTATAVAAALRALDVRRFVLLSPYSDETNAHEVEFLTGNGFEVLAAHGLNLPGSDAYISYPPDAWYERVMERLDERADGYFLSCTNIRAFEVIEELEAATGKPVVASNQASLWHALRRIGVPDAVPGLGRLLAEPSGVPA
ncbi:MAG TPA: aspartate/glutamate racemase family protein [Chloroflexota bacterium]|nr:aspartate/glutamate racemase family protein [Chloroflexota bacterium]